MGKYKEINQPFLHIITPVVCYTKKELLGMHKEYLDNGYEGIILRRGLGPYKEGRVTLNEAFLLKFKRFDNKKIKAIEDAEAKIVGLQQLYHNDNKKEKDAFGYAKRSRKKEGLIPANTLGAFLVQDPKTGVEFKVSARKMTDLDRKKYWEMGPALIGKIIKYEYQGKGPNKKPRFGVFLGFRDERDMS